jgi:predicted mannosyl-3-phosphoglycerate phosphatase (HAD superfamily)
MGWTLKTLLRYVEQRIDSLESKLDERFDTQNKANTTAFDAAGKAVQAALAAAKEASDKAEAAADKRFDGVNEFRQALTDQNATFMSRVEYVTAHGALEDKVTSNSERMTALELRLTSRLDLGQGDSDGRNRNTLSRRAASALNAQWIALFVVAAGVLASILVVVIH